MLTKDKVVWSEHLTEWSRANRVHCAWLQVNQHSTGNVFSPLLNRKKRSLNTH